MATKKLIEAKAAADQLLAARINKTTVESFSARGYSVGEEWAYLVQEIDRNTRLAQGEKIIGIKLGLTSAAKQKSMNVDQPVVGFLTDSMRVENPVQLSQYVQPKIEPELVFKTSCPMTHKLNLDEVGEVIDSFAVGVEIIDSRYTNFKFSYGDVIADNTSAASFLVGEWQPWANQELSVMWGSISRDGQLLHQAPLSEILGNPLVTLVVLSEFLEQQGFALSAGSIVLAGAMTDASALNAGEYLFSITGCKQFSVQVY